MWLCLWFFFLLTMLLYKKREPFTIHMDTDKVHRYLWMPIYRTILHHIPFKYHYRTARQYFKSS